jgi:hypothetical protein
MSIIIALAAVFLGLFWADVVLTLRAKSLPGFSELNPAMRWLIRNPAALIVVGAIFSAAVIVAAVGWRPAGAWLAVKYALFALLILKWGALVANGIKQLGGRK